MLTGFAGAVPTVKGAGYGSLKARSHGFADPEVLVKRQSKAYLGGWTISVFAAETRWPGELQIRLDV
jgi:hypothetical protein